MPFTLINDANFYYELHGEGEPLILIAGYTCDHQVWLPILEPLAKKFQVLLFDNRGAGRTTDDGRALSAELMAQDTMALAAHLGLKKPHIIGQSMGGTIAQHIAVAYPEQISKLAILTSTAKWRQAMLLGLKSTLLMREKNIDFDLIFATLIPWLLGEEFLSHPAKIAFFKQMILENPYPQSLIDQQRQFAVLEKFDGRNFLKKIQVSTLIVHGIEDLLVLEYESEYLAQQIPHAQLVKLKSAHIVAVEATKALAETLINFLLI